MLTRRRFLTALGLGTAAAAVPVIAEWALIEACKRDYYALDPYLQATLLYHPGDLSNDLTPLERLRMARDYRANGLLRDLLGEETALRGEPG